MDSQYLETYGVAKASFWKSLAWEDKHPGQKWSGNNIRQRGKVALLTEEMENELNHILGGHFAADIRRGGAGQCLPGWVRIDGF